MNKSTCSSLLLLSLAGVALHASAADGPTVTVSGFGTAALTMADTDQAEFARPNQVSGAGKTARTGVDSNFGLQATAKINEWLSFTGQGLVRKNATDAYGAELAWAFAKFKVNDDFSVRVGRIGAPVYMVSDFRNVGYANTMIRPPAEVYRQITDDSFDGIDVIYQHSYGDTTLTAQLGAGSAEARIAGNYTAKFKPLTALHVVVENGPLTLRFGRADATVAVEGNAPLEGLLGTLRKVGLGSVADKMAITDVKGSFTSVGMGLDWNNLLVQAEYAKRKTGTLVLMDTTSWYTMLGYRYGKFTPYYYYGKVTQDSPRTIPSLPTSGPFAPLTAGVNYAIQTPLQSTNAIGVRWDFSKSAALKVQMDRVTPTEGAGAFVNAKPGFTGPANVYAAGIDFVF